MIDVGLVGFGFAGKTFHAPVVSAVDGLRLAGIVERHGDEAALAYPTAKLVRSVDELLAIEHVARPDCRAVSAGWARRGDRQAVRNRLRRSRRLGRAR